MKAVQRLLTLSNSMKARIIVAVNSGLALAIGFGLPLDRTKDALIMAAVNSFLALFVHSSRS
jgi:hypothetical protein